MAIRPYDILCHRKSMNHKIIKDHEELVCTIEALKKQGKRIVFTNGGFNLLHVGHVRSLIDANSRGDVLVVALNSDSSIKKNKGADYPLIPEDERLELMAALACVDLLTVFSDPTVDSLLLKLKPHVHAKGTDYTKETVPERATVLSYGGEIAIVGDPKDHASSNIIAMIKNWQGK